jgi:hypothetical protein
MTTVGRLSGALPLVLALAVAGCKEGAAKPSAGPAGAKPAPAAGNPSKPAAEGPSKEDVRKGIGKQLPLVQRFDAGKDLRTLAQLYYADYLSDTPPKKVEDLRDLPASVVNAIKQGEYVVVWNAGKTTPGNAVIAYEKHVPAAGGMVATLNGVVTRMTPQEFREAPKAGGR